MFILFLCKNKHFTVSNFNIKSIHKFMKIKHSNSINLSSFSNNKDLLEIAYMRNANVL